MLFLNPKPDVVVALTLASKAPALSLEASSVRIIPGGKKGTEAGFKAGVLTIMVTVAPR